MGGLPLILARDFNLIPKSAKANKIAACLKSSASLWPKVCTLRLRTNMRAHVFGDAQSGAYADLLMQIRNGEIAIDPQDGLIKHSVKELPYGQHSIYRSPGIRG